MVYINSKSKRGSGGIKVLSPPKDNKELRCEGERWRKENKGNKVKGGKSNTEVESFYYAHSLLM